MDAEEPLKHRGSRAKDLDMAACSKAVTGIVRLCTQWIG